MASIDLAINEGGATQAPEVATDRVPLPQKVGYGLGSVLDMWGHWLYPTLVFHVFNVFGHWPRQPS